MDNGTGSQHYFIENWLKNDNHENSAVETVYRKKKQRYKKNRELFRIEKKALYIEVR